MVGDGPSRAELQQRFPDTVWRGWQFGDDLTAHFSSADCFVFPSRTETFGNVLLEALASGPARGVGARAGTDLSLMAYVARVGRMQLDAGQRKSARSFVKRVHLRCVARGRASAGDGVCVARAGHGVTRRAARERVRQNGGYRAGLIGRGPRRAEGVGGGPLMAAVLGRLGRLRSDSL